MGQYYVLFLAVHLILTYFDKKSAGYVPLTNVKRMWVVWLVGILEKMRYGREETMEPRGAEMWNEHALRKWVMRHAETNIFIVSKPAMLCDLVSICEVTRNAAIYRVVIRKPKFSL